MRHKPKKESRKFRKWGRRIAVVSTSPERGRWEGTRIAVYSETRKLIHYLLCINAIKDVWFF